MTYTLLATLAVAAALVIDVFILRSRVVMTGRFWISYAIVLFFQLLVNGWLTGRAIVLYDESRITGLRVAFAPAEDLLFGFALILLTISVWAFLGRRSDRAGAQ